MQKESLKNPSEDGKKTSVLLTHDLVQKLNASPLNQSQTILEALRFFFSEDKERILEYQNTILSLQKNLSESQQKISILEAQLVEKDFLKSELERVHIILEKQREDYKLHTYQVQNLLNQREEEVRKKDDVIRQREEKIFLLEEGKKGIFEHLKRKILR